MNTLHKANWKQRSYTELIIIVHRTSQYSVIPVIPDMVVYIQKHRPQIWVEFSSSHDLFWPQHPQFPITSSCLSSHSHASLVAYLQKKISLNHLHSPRSLCKCYSSSKSFTAAIIISLTFALPTLPVEILVMWFLYPYFFVSSAWNQLSWRLYIPMPTCSCFHCPITFLIELLLRLPVSASPRFWGLLRLEVATLDFLCQFLEIQHHLDHLHTPRSNILTSTVQEKACIIMFIRKFSPSYFYLPLIRWWCSMAKIYWMKWIILAYTIELQSGI